MGVVYLAHDPSLLRPVAIKILPESLMRDRKRIARFEKEARLLASLNHPNIAVVHSLERTSEGAVFVVMERIEGESLAKRMRKGPLPLADALRICRDVAAGLEAAHARGVIHRDLKPANVMIGDDGRVRVLDFGLATRRDPGRGKEAAHPGVADTWIMEDHLVTEPGLPDSVPPGRTPAGESTSEPGHSAAEPSIPDWPAEELTYSNEILGTPGYLSPEQAGGHPTDYRTDLFAFGCLLFECLAGKKAFPGSNAGEALAAVLWNEPDWDCLPTEIPASTREILLRCLKKEAKERPSGMSEVGKALTEGVEPTPSGLSGRRHNLPRDLTSFIGRERELARIRSSLRSASLLTLTGAGGCGKTRLALRTGREILPETPDGVWLAALASITDPGRVPAAVASALGLREVPGQALSKVIAERIGDRKLLLILDNCEHLVAACAELARELLPACPNLKILATSREILGVAGEVPFAVPSLSLPDSVEHVGSTDLPRYEGCRLFLDRAREASTAFHLEESDAAAIARICLRLDGIPLAIELAAARTRILGVRQIEERLNDRFRLLTGGSRTALERHQTLRATLDWSYALLTPEEKRWLRALSVFTGGWSLEAAGAVGGGGLDEIEVVDALTHLVDKSLIQAEPALAPPRYRMLEMVRQYAREKCELEGESARVWERHLDYFLGLVQEARGHIFSGAEQKAWLDRLEADHENLQAAIHWSGETAEGALKGLMLVVLLGQFWFLRGYGQLARVLLRRALEHDADRAASEKGNMGMERAPEEERLNWRAGALNAAAHFLTLSGDYGQARKLVEEAVQIRRQSGPPLDLARALFTLGEIFWRTGGYGDARRFMEEALVHSRDAGHKGMIATSLNALGAGLYAEGDIDGARRHFEESLALRRELEDRPNTALVLNNLGTMAGLQGDFTLARKYQEEALSLQRELNNPAGIEAVLEERGSTLVECGEPEAATRDFAEALEIAHRLGERPTIAGLYSRVAVLHLRQGMPTLARAPLSQALQIYRSIESAPDLSSCLDLAGCAASELKAHLAAARLFGAAQAHQGGSRPQSYPGDRALVERGREATRRALGDRTFASAVEAGKNLSLDGAVREALDALGLGAPPENRGPTGTE